MTLDPILYRTFAREIGRQFFNKCLGLLPLGIQFMTSCLIVSGKH